MLSYLAGQSILIGAFVFGGITALGIGVLSRNRRVSEDTAIGIIFAAFFALGVVLISRQTSIRTNVASLLFGSVLGVSTQDLIASLLIGAVVVIVLFLLLKEFTLVAFDTTLATALGYPVFRLDLILLLLVSATIVVSLQTVGNILILALIVTPPATARLLTDRLDHMLALSTGIAMTCGVVGLYLSYHAHSAAGGTIVLTATIGFLIALTFAPDHGLLSARIRGRHHVHHYHEADEAPSVPA